MEGGASKDCECCVTEWGQFPVGSGRSAGVSKWISILLPMGDGWEKYTVGTEVRSHDHPCCLPATLLIEPDSKEDWPCLSHRQGAALSSVPS